MNIEKAKKIDEVINFIDPEKSIEKLMKIFYVDRGATSPIKNMIDHLLDETSFLKFLFTGPRGCGKETELIKLSQDKEIRRAFHVIIISNSADIGKLMSGIFEKVIEIAESENVGIADIKKEIDEIKNFNEGWITESELIGLVKEKLPQDIDFGKVKPDEKIMKIVKKKTSEAGSAPDYVKYINTLTEKIYWEGRHKKKDVLILVTNLDKIKRDKVKEFFLDDKLSKINCCVIFTYPFEAIKLKEFSQIIRKYSEDVYYLKHLCPFSEKGLVYNDDYQVLRKIVTKRISEKLFKTPTVLNDIIRYSGGVPYEIFRVVQECARLAARGKSRWDFRFNNKIDEETIAQFVDRKRKLFSSTFDESTKKIFKTVAETHKYDKIDEAEFTSLKEQNLIIQQGPETDIWGEVRFLVNPLIIDVFPELFPSVHTRTGDEEE